MEAKLVFLNGNESREVPLDRFPLAIGRRPDADLYLDDSSVSRFHCVIDEVDGSLVVRDLGSQKGTRINGARIGVSPLKPGDRLAIGDTMLQACYQCSESEEPAQQRGTWTRPHWLSFSHN